jgi:hypothetical protein
MGLFLDACWWITRKTDQMLNAILPPERVVLPTRPGQQECPACPLAVRSLHAAAHNALVEYDREQGRDMARFRRKMAALAAEVEAFQPVVDRHFAEANSGPITDDELRAMMRGTDR